MAGLNITMEILVAADAGWLDGPPPETLQRDGRTYRLLPGADDTRCYAASEGSESHLILVVPPESP